MAQDQYIEAIKSLFDDPKELEIFLASISKPLPKSIKIIESRMDISTFQSEAKRLGWALSQTSFGDDLPDMYYVDREDREIALGKTLLHLLGFCYIQEIAASLPAHFLDIPEGGKVLDMSAAPGGKTVQLADVLLTKNPNKPGLVRANDVDRQRLGTRANNIQRCAMYNTCATNFDGAIFGRQFPETFDAVLLDAPCSGEGTGFKSDAALQWRRLEEIKKIAGLQYQLFESAVQSCKIGGSLIYSTCTMNPRENEKNIQNILADYAGSLVLEDIVLHNKSEGITCYQEEDLLTGEEAKKLVRCRPHKQATGGFFVAKIRKIASTQKAEHSTVRPKQASRNNKFTTSSKLQKDIRKYCKQERGMELPLHYLFLELEKGDIRVVSDAFREVTDIARFSYVGVPVMKRVREWYIPLHSFGPILWSYAKDNLLSLDDEAMQKYSRFEPVEGEKTQDNSFKIIKRHNRPVSVAKQVKWELKNKFMKR